MNTYTIKEIGSEGEVVGEQNVTANEYIGALRQIKDVAQHAEKIDVFDHEGEKVGGTLVGYWKKNYRRR